MIKINYAPNLHAMNTSLGNRLFQYCMGRILAEKYGRALMCGPIPGFNVDTFISGDMVWGEDYHYLSGHILNENELPLKSWMIDGYFQRYEYYRPHKYKIKNVWLKNRLLVMPDYRVCNIHLRLGDYVDLEQTLPIDYYLRCVDAANKIKIVNIITDQPEHEFAIQLAKEIETRKNIDGVGLLCHRGLPLEDFLAIQGAGTIILSQSTFGWWAAWLSDAARIFFPQSKCGYWSVDRPDIDLWVDDEERYIKVNV